MRFLILTFLILVSALSAIADEDADLRHLLTLLSEAHIGDDYNAIKVLVPEIEALHSDADDDNTEALFKTRFGKIDLRGEFNFSKGHLVSHGFESGELTHSDAHAFLLHCVTILEELYGPSERHIQLPSEIDGPNDSIGISFNWHQDKTFFGLDFHYRSKFATVSWGAQAE
ncbi:MAG: hypothetical protein ABI992_09550 [Chthoniobacterales bacterium]